MPSFQFSLNEPTRGTINYNMPSENRNITEMRVHKDNEWRECHSSIIGFGHRTDDGIKMSILGNRQIRGMDSK